MCRHSTDVKSYQSIRFCIQTTWSHSKWFMYVNGIDSSKIGKLQHVMQET